MVRNKVVPSLGGMSQGLADKKSEKVKWKTEQHPDFPNPPCPPYRALHVPLCGARERELGWGFRTPQGSCCPTSVHLPEQLGPPASVAIPKAEVSAGPGARGSQVLWAQPDRA